MNREQMRRAYALFKRITKETIFYTERSEGLEREGIEISKKEKEAKKSFEVNARQVNTTESDLNALLIAILRVPVTTPNADQILSPVLLRDIEVLLKEIDND